MRRRLEVLSVYLAGLGQGLAMVTIPALANVFKSPEHHALSSSQYGALFLPFTASAIAMAGASGRMSARVGMKRVVMLGVGLLAAAMAVVASTVQLPSATASRFWVLLMAMALLGGGVGACISAINTYPARFFPKTAEGALTGLHAVLGLGTALPPLLLPTFVRLTGWWGLPVFEALSLGALVVGLGLVLTDAPKTSSASGQVGEWAKRPGQDLSFGWRLTCPRQTASGWAYVGAVDSLWSEILRAGK